MSRIGQVWERMFEYDVNDVSASLLYLVIGEGMNELTLLNLETGQTCITTYMRARACDYNSSTIVPILGGRYSRWRRFM